MIGFLDCSTGVSGDKFLGALLDAGRTEERFTARDVEAAITSIAPEARVIAENTSSYGISACRVRVEANAAPPLRTWPQIRAAIESAPLPEPVAARTLSAFELLASVESAIHGKPADEVHFHEIGALDSLLDVVGTCLGLHALGINRLVASPVAVGGGSVCTAHGTLPVPAPATAALLLGVPTTAGPPEALERGWAELTTPTGAALVRTLANHFGPWPAMTATSIGYGAGTRDIGCANVCRITIGEPAAGPLELRGEEVALLETNIDHISPESAAFTAEQLLGEGALDAWISPVVMKKGRPAFVLSVLTEVSSADAFASRIVLLTGSLGVRRTTTGRLTAARETRTAETPYGTVQFKVGPGGARPEADDVARIARETHRGFTDVARELAAFGESAGD